MRSPEEAMIHKVCFSHGKLGTPDGGKIKYLSAIARQKGWQVESLDYQHTMDPDKRLEILRHHAPQGSGGGKLILAGSSMGGYISTAASNWLRPDGLFLLAPAFYLPGYKVRDPDPNGAQVVMVHGWSDDTVPPAHALRFAQKYQPRLIMVNSDHRLRDVWPIIGEAFGRLLDEVGGEG
ncbi:MAG: alpha/beta hydrolase [Magnetococcales bacterium]|nr:alpha/beta hydrolase [Magnetococcales bacterium]